MIDPKEVKRIRAQLDALNIDKATLEKAAESMLKIPQLRKILEDQALKEGFKSRVDNMYDEVQEIFDNHKEHPDGNDKK